MQLVSSRIWTRVAVFISYDDNHYTAGTPDKVYNTLLLNRIRPEVEKILRKNQIGFRKNWSTIW